MAGVCELGLCSVCNKSSARCFCVGCKKHFCSKDFKEHEQQLSTRFDDEVVTLHDELLDKIQKFKNSENLSLNPLNEIEQWEIITIDKIHKAAERARHEIIEIIDKQKKSMTQQLEMITREIRNIREEENFVEQDIVRLQTKLNTIRQIIEQFTQEGLNQNIIIDYDDIAWNGIICIRENNQNFTFTSKEILDSETSWLHHGIIVAGEDGFGGNLSQLYHPCGFSLDDDRTIYIAEWSNHRILQWKTGDITGRVVAGGNGQGSRADQLNSPTHVTLDKRRDQLFICDFGNKRVVQWPRQNGTRGEIIISNIGCQGATIDDNGLLYVVDYDQHEVRRYQIGNGQGVVVAGGNGPGIGLNQLNHPRYVFVDREHSVYVSDTNNHRVMKWRKDERQGCVVAGDQNPGNHLSQLSNPYGIFVDRFRTVYIADYSNNRIVRWRKGAKEGDLVAGGNSCGNQSNQLHGPIYLSFDRIGNLYVSNYCNSRINMFQITCR